MQRTQSTIDIENAEFWDELCGTEFARRVGVTDSSPESLARFDRAYLDYYPYLDRYLPDESEVDKRVLEVGLGYGTVGELLACRGLDYRGLDIAPGPVEMMRHRLRNLGRDDADELVRRGSALEMPYDEASFDYVVTIGCLHHTGDIPRAVSEVHRVLRPGGVATVMLYARYSLHRAALAVWKLPAAFRRDTTLEREIRRAYDETVAGEPAPMVDFVTRGEIKRMFERFGGIGVRRENWDPMPLIPRRWLLGSVARVMGIDFYVTATK
jgi:SAM-dependent methyltransferase